MGGSETTKWDFRGLGCFKASAIPSLSLQNNDNTNIGTREWVRDDELGL